MSKKNFLNPTFWAISPILIGITLLGRSSQNISQTTYPLVGRELLAMSNAMIGIVTAAAGIAGILASALLVTRIQVKDRLSVLAIGQALGAVAFALFAISNTRLELWAGAIALGTGGGITFPLLMTVIGQGRRTQRSKSLAVFALALSASLVLGPLIEAGVLHLVHDSLRETFSILLILPLAATVITLIAAFKSRRETALPNKQRSTSATESMAKASSDFTQKTLPSDTEIASASNYADKDLVTSKRSFRVALLTLLTYQAPFVALVAFGGLLARYVDHISATGIELSFGLFFTLSFAIRALISAKSPIHHSSRVIIGSALGTMIGIAVVGLTHTTLGFIAGMAILGAPHGATFPMASSILAENTPGRLLGKANGRLMASTNVATVLIPFICGWLVQEVGYSQMFLLLEIPVMSFATALIIQLFRHPLESIHHPQNVDLDTA